jgi:hypothetical protein
MSPALAWGASVGLKTESALEYDSNVARTSRGAEDDMIFRTIQRVSLSERGDGYGYSLHYALPYSISLRTNVIDNLDHLGGGTLDFDLGPRTKLALDGRFSITHGTSPFQDQTQIDDGSSVPRIVNRGEQITNFNASLSLNHGFTSRILGNFNVAYRLFDSTQINRRRVNTIAGATGLNYLLNSRNRVGAGVNFSYQDFSDLPGQPGSMTLTTRIFASWVYRFDESLAFSIRAGPTLIATHQRGADPLVEFPSAFVFEEVDQSRTIPILFDLEPPPDGDGASDTLVANTDVSAGDLLVFAVDQCGSPADDPSITLASLCTAPSWIPNIPANAAAIDAVLNSGPTVLTFVDPPGAPPSFNDFNMTIFGSANLTKRWSPRVNSGVGYRRTQSDASGLGGSAVLDAVNAFVSWKVSKRMNATLRADWTQRESVSPTLATGSVIEACFSDPALCQALDDVIGLPTVAELTGDRVFRKISRRIDSQRWAIAGLIRRTITPNLDVNLRASFNQQSSRSGTAGSSTDFNEFSVIFGFSYAFNPIEVW